MGRLIDLIPAAPSGIDPDWWSENARALRRRCGRLGDEEVKDLLLPGRLCDVCQSLTPVVAEARPPRAARVVDLQERIFEACMDLQRELGLGWEDDDDG